MQQPITAAAFKPKTNATGAASQQGKKKPVVIDKWLEWTLKKGETVGKLTKTVGYVFAESLSKPKADYNYGRISGTQAK